MQLPTLRSLQRLCCETICHSGEVYIERVISQLPCQVAPMLLHEAIEGGFDGVTTCLVACWPLTELRVSELLSIDQRFQIERPFLLDKQLFAGLTSRRLICKMQVLDLRNLDINFSFSAMLLLYLPLLTIEKQQLDSAILAEEVMKSADECFKTLVKGMWLGREYYSPDTWSESSDNQKSLSCVEIIKFLIDEMLKVLNGYNLSRIPIGIGDTLHVFLDKLQVDIVDQFTQGKHPPDQHFFIKLLIATRLQAMLQVRVKFSNIVIRRPDGQTSHDGLEESKEYHAHLFLNNQCINYLLNNQLQQGLNGVWFHSVNLGDVINDWSIPPQWTCRWLTSLGLRDSRLHVTRRELPDDAGKRQLRLSWIVSLVRGLPNLTSLDISNNHLCGHLSAILEAFARPLCCLNISGLAFSEEDVSALAKWSHASDLRELVISGGSLYFGIMSDEAPPDAVPLFNESRRSCPAVRALRRYTSLQKLCLAYSDLNGVDDLCDIIIDGCWPELSMLDVGCTNMWSSEAIRLTGVALARCSKLKKLCIRLLTDDLVVVMRTVERSGRTDLGVKVSVSTSSCVISDGDICHQLTCMYKPTSFMGLCACFSP